MQKIVFSMGFSLFLLCSAGICVAQVLASPQMVEANGHRLSMLITGQGAATVVFESGLGGSKGDWQKVQPLVARFARTVAYDRAGLADSEPAPLPRTARDRASDLHAALHKAHVPPPYVLVGHSAGGPYIRVFASMYPTEVAGMVFVDASQEEFFQQLKINLPQDWRKFQKLLAYGLQAEDLADAARDELRSFEEDMKMAHDAWPLPDVPVIALSALIHPEVSEEAMHIWLAAHGSLADRFTDFKHIRVADSGHDIHNENPKVVIEAIRQVVKSAEKSGRY